MYTVLICTHNRSHVLPRALDAVDKLETPPGETWEVIVVDNASSDDTAEIVKDFSARASAPVRYIREERLGKSFALNTGIAAARGEVLAQTDDDALPHTDWLVRIDEAFRRHEADIVFGPVRPEWESGPPRWFSPRFLGGFALLDYGNVPFAVSDAIHSLYSINSACRMRVFRKLGGFREDLGPLGRTSRVGEDTDLFLRALEDGMRVVYEPSIVVNHIIPASRCKKADLRSRIWQQRETQYRDLHDKFATCPWLLGLPRWYFRDAVTNARGYAKSLCRRDPGEAFYYELQLRRFLVQSFEAALHAFGLKHPVGQAKTEGLRLNTACDQEARDSNVAARV